MRVALEAKIDAPLGVGQLVDHARFAQDSLLGVIVPERRTEEAAGMLQLAADELRDLNVKGLLLTWDEGLGSRIAGRRCCRRDSRAEHGRGRHRARGTSSS